MTNCLLIIAVLTCLLSVFLVLDVEQLRPYQDVIKSYIPERIKSVVDSSFSFVRPRERVFTKDELAKFTGSDGGNIYMTILGSVFDVTTGSKHYGPEGGYSGFAGRDGTRAFITGEFTDEGLTENIDGLSLDDILGLQGWKEFYGKDYRYIGKLDGYFYDSNGQPTANMRSYQRQLQLAREKQKQSDDENHRFPPCNSESRQDSPLRIWCSNLSGGISRDWVGVPREFHQPGRTHMRCACIRTTGHPSSGTDRGDHNNRGDLDDPRFRVYPGCDPISDTCFVKRS